jgi:hypothetical protein
VFIHAIGTPTSGSRILFGTTPPRIYLTNSDSIGIRLITMPGASTGFDVRITWREISLLRDRELLGATGVEDHRTERPSHSSTQPPGLRM